MVSNNFPAGIDSACSITVSGAINVESSPQDLTCARRLDANDKQMKETDPMSRARPSIDIPFEVRISADLPLLVAYLLT